MGESSACNLYGYLPIATTPRQDASTPARADYQPPKSHVGVPVELLEPVVTILLLLLCLKHQEHQEHNRSRLVSCEVPS